MPEYRYQCKACQHEWDEMQRVDARYVPLQNVCENCKIAGKIELIIQPVAIGDSVRLGITKPKSDFKEVLQQIKKNNPRSTINI